MISKLMTALKTLGQTWSEEDSDTISFHPGIPMKKWLPYLKKGYWHILPLGHDSYSVYGLRIMPDKKWEEWPVVVFNDLHSAVTIAPDSSAALPLIRYQIITGDQEMFTYMLEGWNRYKALALPLQKILGNTADLDEFKQFLEAHKPDDSPGNEDALFLKLWYLYDTTAAHKAMRTAITEMEENDEYLPSLSPDKSYGIWQTRLYHLFARHLDISHVEKALKDAKLTANIITAFDEPLCYDNEYGGISQFPNRAIEPDSLSVDLAALILTEEDNKWVQADPLFPVMQELTQKRKSKYIGTAHMEAAALLDDQLDRPLRSWNALVSAAYWSGKNLQETALPAWEAAIYLCKKNKWKDALMALEYQLNEYKK
ncbi:hypothetical protein [Chitinophaga defluvii]|uniref:DUF4034 domain-containing protein n=1 Tax=Chitinophaga defluvii TaxID=3163343 RepID=A0ABV2T2T0_9BACT